MMFATQAPALRDAAQELGQGSPDEQLFTGPYTGEGNRWFGGGAKGWYYDMCMLYMYTAYTDNMAFLFGRIVYQTPIYAI